ncbi:hypothetical protein [Naasia sp. SYSU D00948]|uniref:hypothetical protein n=1 Tax=Naasia sp. SYSU D00948 TaxID=2817379 RepID=UPI001B30C4D5|nr:hypothetical protein [Naasia sp. SYSU D00948]
MPSYRVTLTVGALRPGVPPESVLPAAADAVKELTTLEASSVAVVRGEPRLVVRFTAEDDEIARQIAAHAASVAGQLAEVLDARVTRRSRNRWLRVPEDRG